MMMTRLVEVEVQVEHMRSNNISYHHLGNQERFQHKCPVLRHCHHYCSRHQKYRMYILISMDLQWNHMQHPKQHLLLDMSSNLCNVTMRSELRDRHQYKY